MSAEPDDIRERAWVEYRRQPHSNLDEPMWVAEDPVTNCAGMGYVETEAVGNLVSVVIESNRSSESSQPLLKLPGRVVNRPTPRTDDTDSLFDRLLSLF